ncbi:TPA: DapH/DapD/GlmU-related protein [Bacillus paranthracis]|nr:MULTISPECIES: acyltransferase [Bacillus]KLA17445.1 hypothetical protein B4087_5594 [Bacillus cereus]MDG1597671.1 acyltransferase [Bacillus cereus]HDX9540067.1 acyltransferase [Bacillus thuringiensis]HEF5236933.1 acyltransferase [Bacillus cereus]
MNKKIKILMRLLRGLIFKLLHADKGGKLLRVTGSICVSREKQTNLFLGDKVVLYKDVGFYLDKVGATVTIGDRTYINRRTEIMCKEKVEIGKDCAISWDVTITDTDYHSINNRYDTSPVKIGNNVWIGCNATILKGVCIADGAVIAANSVVTRDVPPNCLVAGVPGEVVKEGIKWR